MLPADPGVTVEKSINFEDLGDFSKDFLLKLASGARCRAKAMTRRVEIYS